MRSETIAIASVCAFACAARADDGCSKDLECKGERICVQRQCVDPTPAGRPPAVAPRPDPSPRSETIGPQGLLPGSSSPSTNNRHLGGFIRPDLGFGFISASASQGGTSVTISGLAGTFGIAFGAAVSENQILAFHFWDAVATGPSVTVNGTVAANPNTTMTVIAFGAEYTVYSAGNAYLSFTPSITRGTLSESGASSDTNWGLGLRAGVGKEWWVSDHWGLGIVGHVSLTANQDAGTNPPTWFGWSTTVAFSATYN